MAEESSKHRTLTCGLLPLTLTKFFNSNLDLSLINLFLCLNLTNLQQVLDGTDKLFCPLFCPADGCVRSEKPTSLVSPYIKIIPISLKFKFRSLLSVAWKRSILSGENITIFCLSTFCLLSSCHSKGQVILFFSSSLRLPPNNLQTNTSTHCPFRSFTVLYFFPTHLCPVAIHSILQARVHAHLIPLLPPQ